MDDGDAAARAERRALDVRELRRRARQLERRRRRARVRVAERIPADFARRPQIAFEQRRRERLDVGDVVEVVADGVRRQERRNVDVDRQQIANRSGVFGPIQPLERAAAGIRTDGGRLVDVRFERHNQRVERGRVRPLLARGRHHACPQLPDHLLGDVRRLIRARRIERLEAQPALLLVVVMTGEAVLLDQRALGLRRECERRSVRNGEPRGYSLRLCGWHRQAECDDDGAEDGRGGLPHCRPQAARVHSRSSIRPSRGRTVGLSVRKRGVR